MNIYKKGNKSRSDITMSMMGVPLTVSAYELPAGKFSCITFMGNVTCTEGSGGQTSVLNPEQSLGAMESMIERGIASFSYMGAGRVANRACHNITTDFNVSKLSLLTAEEMAALGMNLTDISSLSSIKKLRTTQCYDSETGMVLHINLFMEMDMSGMQTGTPITISTISVEIEMAATSFEPNKAIPDSTFDLPAEPTANCAGEGGQFSGVYTTQYPEHCCAGLTEWESGMDTRVSVAGECYETGLLGGSPVGTCISCGDGTCDPGLEDVCNCPGDCQGGRYSAYATADEFCADDTVISLFSAECAENLQNLTICGLCTWE
jgi:hypothetical protein